MLASIGSGKGVRFQDDCGDVGAGFVLTHCVPGQRRGALGHRGSLFRLGRAAFGMLVRALLMRAGPRPQGAHRSIATETEIIKLLMRQFLTNKSVFEDWLYDKMAGSNPSDRKSTRLNSSHT